MATISTTPEIQKTSETTASLVVSLSPLPRDAFDRVLQNLAAAFAGQSVLVASTDAVGSQGGPLQVVGYTPAATSVGAWTLVAADFLNAYELAQKHQASAVLLLGAESQSLEPEGLRALADAVLHHAADLAVPRYSLPPRAGLVNSAILYPISRALFGASPRFPLAIDLACSLRMLQRLATAAQRFTASNQADALLWPVAEAAVGGFQMVQVDFGSRILPQPPGADLNSVLAQVAGSLFADVDAKAAFWQRARLAQPTRAHDGAASHAVAAEDVQPMLESFRLAYRNLHEIWSLVLPPQSLLGLKRLSALPVESFAMPDTLWARVVYDFLLAYRLRTINRGHLLGALTPLYLAWVASHILRTGSGIEAEHHIEAVAAAFEADKAYLVSRWRWPDRFNP